MNETIDNCIQEILDKIHDTIKYKSLQGQFLIENMPSLDYRFPFDINDENMKHIKNTLFKKLGMNFFTIDRVPNDNQSLNIRIIINELI